MNDRPPLSGQLSQRLEEPMYSAAEAARLVGLSATRVRRWLRGYEYDYDSERRRQKPVIRGHKEETASYGSFLDLVDLLFAKRFVDHGLSLQRLRRALDEAARILNSKHFARQSFFTDGRNIYLEVKEAGNAILELLSGGQWVIPDLIRELAEKIDFDTPTGIARKWYPLGQDGLVVLDPLVSFGRPSVIGKGVATNNVYDLFVAEGRNVRPVCRWLSLDRQEVDAAVRFEEQLAA